MTRLSLRGEIDIATLPGLEQALRGASETDQDLVVDLSELTFIDAAGLHLLAQAAARMNHAGRRLTLTDPTPHVRRVLTVLGLDHLTAD